MRSMPWCRLSASLLLMRGTGLRGSLSYASRRVTSQILHRRWCKNGAIRLIQNCERGLRLYSRLLKAIIEMRGS